MQGFMGAIRGLLPGRMPPPQVMQPAPEVKAIGTIGVEHIRKANDTMRRYKDGKKNLERMAISSENWWKMRNWREIDPGKSDEPVSAWLWNCITGKHADAMAAYPEPIVLPRMQDDKMEAKKLSSILPVVMEQNDFQEVYSDCTWQKLIQGTAIYGVFWDSNKLNGLGDIAIRKVDVLNLYWEPGVTDIQKSRNVFHVDLADNETLEEMYPQLKGKLKSGGNFQPSRYQTDDNIDYSNKSLVVDWYYKKGNKLHFVKYVGEDVLFATENEPEKYPDGWYSDGKYPFVFDRLFPVHGTPCGYSYINVGKSPQESLDRLNAAMIKSVTLSATPRFFARNDGAVNEKEFADFTKPFVHVSGNLGDDSLKQIVVNPPPPIAVQMYNNKVEELKFTCGNMDVNNGGSVSGVTAASAIAALQEAAGRTSRDSSMSAYRAYARVITMVIERIRQFYQAPRFFRILGEMGEESFMTYNNQGLQNIPIAGIPGQELFRSPVFDIEVKAQKENPYTRISQNELAIQMMGMGVFNPQIADQALMLLDMMDFDGKDELMQKIQRNGTMFQMLQQYQQMALALASKYEPQMAQGLAQQMAMTGFPMPQAMPAASMQGDNIKGIENEPAITRNARGQTAQAPLPQ